MASCGKGREGNKNKKKKREVEKCKRLTVHRRDAGIVLKKKLFVAKKRNLFWEHKTSFFFVWNLAQSDEFFFFTGVEGDK